MTALEENTVSGDAFQQFNLWYGEARQAGEDFPDAMALATVGKDGAPSARVVLLRAVGEGCLVFFTSYTSRKGEELKDNPRAAAVFHWPKLSRQVRAEGSVEPAPAEESDAYFPKPLPRKPGSRLGLRAEQGDPGKAVAGRALERIRRKVQGRRSQAAGLGRVQTAGQGDGVLAVQGAPPARPFEIYSGRKRGVAH